MKLVKRTPNSLPFLFDELRHADWLGGTLHRGNEKRPAVNIEESEDNFVLELVAPGRAKEDFNITLEHETLVISATSKIEDSSNGSLYKRKEFEYQSFERAFKLPKTVENSEITAAYEHGILVIRIPKREEAKAQPKRIIAIT